MVQTVIKEQYKSETLTFRNELFETDHTFEVYGQTVDRSYEDRDVYFNGIWIRGEDAIQLGQALIKHGTNALMANMINHQLILESKRLKEWMNAGVVDKVQMTMVDEKPANHGNGFRTFLIKPVFKQDKTPEYYENWSYEQVIYWSPFHEEYQKELESFGGNVEFIGYNHDKEVDEFNAWCKELENEHVNLNEGCSPEAINATESPSEAAADGC